MAEPNTKKTKIVMPFGDHLEELRARLIRALIAPVLVAIPCLIFGKYILQIMLRPVQEALALEHLPSQLQALSPVEPFISYIKISVVAAIVVSAPIILYQLWRFVSPGLHAHEKRFARLLVPFSAILMIVGIVFLYTVVLPLSLQMLIRFGKALDMGPREALVQPVTTPQVDENGNPIVETDPNPEQGTEIPSDPDADADLPAIPTIPMLDHQPADFAPGQIYFDTRLNQTRLMLPNGEILGSDFKSDTGLSQQYQLKTYLNLVLGLTLAFSIAFQLPLVLLLLGWVGIVNVKFLRTNRKYAFLLVFVAGAMLTPPDVISQIALGIPLYMLYELGILLLIFFPSSSSLAGIDSADSSKSD